MGANRYSIREQTAGRHQARWYDSDGKRRSKTFATKTEAKKFLDNLSADLNRGDYIDPSDARRTFREVAELWFESRNLRPKTSQSYRTILEQRTSIPPSATGPSAASPRWTWSRGSLSSAPKASGSATTTSL